MQKSLGPLQVRAFRTVGVMLELDQAPKFFQQGRAITCHGLPGSHFSPFAHEMKIVQLNRVIRLPRLPFEGFGVRAQAIKKFEDACLVVALRGYLLVLGKVKMAAHPQ
jgi:hypothetical protein